MNGIKYLIDTNIIIGLLKGNSTVVDKLLGTSLQICAYSAITRMEILGFPGITETEKQAISTALNRMTHINIDQAVEDATITFKQQHHVKLPDAIIAATAITHQIELMTLDKKLAKKLQPSLPNPGPTGEKRI